MAEIPEDLKQDYDAWKLHRTARFRIEDWMDWGTKAIERIEQARGEQSGSADRDKG